MSHWTQLESVCEICNACVVLHVGFILSCLSQATYQVQSTESYTDKKTTGSNNVINDVTRISAKKTVSIFVCMIFIQKCL